MNEIAPPEIAHEARVTNAALVAKLFGKQAPYTHEEMRQRRLYKIKYRLSDCVREEWYEAEATQQFLCNGLLPQLQRLHEEGQTKPCAVPDPATKIVAVEKPQERGWHIDAVVLPWHNGEPL